MDRAGLRGERSLFSFPEMIEGHNEEALSKLRSDANQVGL